ncbi:MAG: hypothetical protein HLUCCO02_09045 [Idiomarinaceae bacterium HL-53]|nr:MAG: hypothetical protein HLUCCO02_09045 [Idiomarinaceae bacterium HL-53]
MALSSLLSHRHIFLVVSGKGVNSPLQWQSGAPNPCNTLKILMKGSIYEEQ